MQRSSYSFRKIKQLDDEADDGAFEGLLATYGNVDLGGDVIMPGAFTKTLQDSKGKFPLLWQHKSDQPIGILTLSDTSTGLLAKGSLLLGLPQADAAYKLLKAGVIKGMSIGYDTIVESFENGVRLLKELKLWEGSIVTFPMNEQAMVTAVKAANDEEAEVLAALKALTTKAHDIGEPAQQQLAAHVTPFWRRGPRV